jgi:hypothetical protein
MELSYYLQVVFDDIISTVLTFLTGLGSGIYVGIASGTVEPFIIPLITVLLGSTIYKAIGTSLFVDCIIGLIAGLVFFRKGQVKIKPVMLLGASGSIAALIGSVFSKGTPESNLKILIAVVLIFFGYMLLRGGIKRNVETINQKVNLAPFQQHKNLSLLFFGGLIGFASGFTGMGSSGSMTIILIFIMGYSLHQAIGTSLMLMFFITGAGSSAHSLQGNILLQSALIAGLGAAIGATSGSLFANRIDEDKLGRTIGLIIIILGLVFLADVLINFI